MRDVIPMGLVAKHIASRTRGFNNSVSHEALASRGSGGSTPNLHRSWPRNCSKPRHKDLPRVYVSVLDAMRIREQAHYADGQHDWLAVATHPHVQPASERERVDELAHVQACQYATLDAWTRLARALNISWAAQGGSLFGAVCYRAMAAWDDDIDIVVPQEECGALDRIWDESNTTSAPWGRANYSWQPRRTHFGLTVWKSETGQAATNGHRKFTMWDPLTAPHGRREHGIDVMCTGHVPEYTMPGGQPVRDTQNLPTAIRNGHVAPVEFGPTTILQVPRRVALQFITWKRWDSSCNALPPLNAKAAAALKAYIWTPFSGAEKAAVAEKARQEAEAATRQRRRSQQMKVTASHSTRTFSVSLSRHRPAH